MNRRILGFLAGAGLSFAGAYLVKRFRPGTANSPVYNAPFSPTGSQDLGSGQDSPNSMKNSSPVLRADAPPRQENNPVPAQTNTDNSHKINRSTEPLAATETDSSAISARSEIAEETFPHVKVEPAKTGPRGKAGLEEISAGVKKDEENSEEEVKEQNVKSEIFGKEDQENSTDSKSTS